MNPLVQSIETLHAFDGRIYVMLVLMVGYCVAALSAVAAFWLGWGRGRLTLAVHRRILAMVLGSGCFLVLALFLWALPAMMRWALTLSSVLPIPIRLLLWLQELPASTTGAALVLGCAVLIAWIPVRTREGLKLLTELLAVLNLLCLGLSLTLVTGLSSLHSAIRAVLGAF